VSKCRDCILNAKGIKKSQKNQINKLQEFTEKILPSITMTSTEIGFIKDTRIRYIKTETYMSQYELFKKLKITIIQKIEDR
jgi:hypothetical protein